MSTIKSKEYQWGKFYTNGELAAGIVSVLLAYISSLRGDSIGLLLLIVFIIIALIGFVHFFYLKTNKTYIQINTERIKIFPKFYLGNVNLINWSNISKIEKIVRKRLILKLRNDKKVSINLGVLGKEDRDNIIQLIKESMKHSSDIPDKPEKATHKNSEAAYSMVEDNNGIVSGIWLKDPDKLNPDQKGYVETLLVSNASHLLGDYIAKKFRVITNNYDSAGGCFVMFGGNKAPGE